jgi:TRAP-type C4-dicarboxylate transport system substrate-binding protein
VGCSTAASNSSEEGTITLSYAFFAPHNSFPAIQMEHWANELGARTDGKVEVEMYYGGTLLTAENMIDGVGVGTADIGITATSYEPHQYPLLKISDLPSGFPNATISSQVVNELIKEFPPKALEGFEVIAVLTTEPAYIQVSETVNQLSDLEKKNLRVAGSVSEVAEELNISPVGMSQAEVVESLEIGVVDGYITSREVLKDFSLAENISTVIDYPLHTTTFIAVMNKETWKTLPKDVQKVITELRDEMSRFAGNYHDEQIVESVEWSQNEHGTEIVELSEEEERELENIMDNLQKEYVEELENQGLPAIEYYNRLYELIGELQ